MNNQNEDKDAALHFACLNSNVEVVKLLLARGADPRLRNGDGKTPADLDLELNGSRLAILHIAQLDIANDPLGPSSCGCGIRYG